MRGNFPHARSLEGQDPTSPGIPLNETLADGDGQRLSPQQTAALQAQQPVAMQSQQSRPVSPNVAISGLNAPAIFREQSPRPRRSPVANFGSDIRGRTADREEAADHSRNINWVRFGGSHRRAPSPVNDQSTDTQLRDMQANVWHFAPLGSNIEAMVPTHDTARGRDRPTSTVDDGSRSGRQIPDRTHADQSYVRRPINDIARENGRATVTVESRTGHRVRDRTYVGEGWKPKHVNFAERMRRG